jgi:transposase
VGKTKKGKGTKVMAIVDEKSKPLSIVIASASIHEMRLVEALVKEKFSAIKPRRLTGDKAYDADTLDKGLKKKGIELNAPHRKGRRKKPTQDGRKLQAYKRRWKVERFFAWLFNFRRCVVRYEQ